MLRELLDTGTTKERINLLESFAREVEAQALDRVADKVLETQTWASPWGDSWDVSRRCREILAENIRALKEPV